MTKPTHNSLERVAQVQANYVNWLMHQRYVVGVAVGPRADDPGGYCLVVLVEQLPVPEELVEDEWVPQELDGVPVEIRLTGGFFADFAAGG